MKTQQVQTLEAIEKTYHDQWVLLKETDWDKQGNPIKGIVIAHGIERDDLVQPRIKIHEQEPNVKTYAFYVGDIVPEGIALIL